MEVSIKKVAIKAFTSMVALVVLFSGLSGTMQVFTKEFSVRASALALVYGDVNDDGKINAVDLTLVKRKISSPGFSGLNLASADVTGDGTVNYYDREVNNLMSGVQSREEALEMLNYIRECLEQGTFPT